MERVQILMIWYSDIIITEKQWKQTVKTGKTGEAAGSTKEINDEKKETSPLPH